eukprot:gb/GECG01010206.1/.p1 GENE.gb/GECG01010206.1/~~gb/GECG01010206.1/.p1  ORF type:complete len:173 (+),score=13.93 gb/GECG01010206.1/:1-519(+)
MSQEDEMFEDELPLTEEGRRRSYDQYAGHYTIPPLNKKRKTGQHTNFSRSARHGGSRPGDVGHSTYLEKLYDSPLSRSSSFLSDDERRFLAFRSPRNTTRSERMLFQPPLFGVRETGVQRTRKARLHYPKARMPDENRHTNNLLAKCFCCTKRKNMHKRVAPASDDTRGLST